MLASDVKGAIWSSGTYADWLLWKEPVLRGRLAWDIRYELLTAPEMRAIVRFNRHKPGWQRSLQGYPVLVLDRRRHGAQVRSLLAAPGVHVLFADDAVVVLAGRRAVGHLRPLRDWTIGQLTQRPGASTLLGRRRSAAPVVVGVEAGRRAVTSWGEWMRQINKNFV